MKNTRTFSTNFKIVISAVILSTFLFSCGGGSGISLSENAEIFSAESLINDKVDILFVVDNSGSMGPEQTNLASSFSAFIQNFVDKNLNYQVGVLSTDMNAGSFPAAGSRWDPTTSGAYFDIYNGGPGTLLSKNSSEKLVSPLLLDPVSSFIANVNLGTIGSAAEVPMLSIQEFLNQAGASGYNESFLRENAFLSVIIVTDEDEGTAYNNTTHINGNSALETQRLDDTEAAILAAKGGLNSMSRVDVISWSASTPECAGNWGQEGLTVRKLADRFSGEKGSVCTDFSATLDNFSNAIIQDLLSVPLAQPPATIESIEVQINSAVIPMDATNGWTYNSGEQKIEFHGTYIPTGTDSVKVTYLPGAAL